MAYGIEAFNARNPLAWPSFARQEDVEPTLVCDAEKDLYFQGQSQQLFAHLKCPKTFMMFTDAEGAGAHCEAGVSRLAYARMYDWLDETLSAV
jgi:hypothetical protein